MSNVTCVSCGWVHMKISRPRAEVAVRRFNEYYAGLSEEKQQELYGGKGARIKEYEGCFACGNKRFRPSKPGDCPNGCTIQPVIVE